MNLFDLSPIEQPQGIVRTKQGGWAGTLPDGYTRMVDGKKFTARTYPREGQVLMHKLPGGDIRIHRDGSISWYNDHDKLHREDGPAMTYADGTEMWYHNGDLHREDGPAIVKADGTEIWFRRGTAHREDGPAVTQADGSTEWYYHGKLHREDGPAITWAGGSAWYRHGRPHREDGPAVVKANGTEEYWLHGKRVDKEDLS